MWLKIYSDKKADIFLFVGLSATKRKKLSLRSLRLKQRMIPSGIILQRAVNKS